MVEDLSQQERELIANLIKDGKPVPARYIPSISDSPLKTELIWPGKSTLMDTSVLPFQSIEHIDEPRKGTSQQFDLFSISESTGRQSGGWTNKLIWGDNSLILSSLVNGPMRNEIEKAGGLKLVYIDPPFDVGSDFAMDIEVGEDSVKKKPSVVEEVAYRDTWGKGIDSYASMIYSRIRMIHELLASDGAIYVHVDYRTSALVRFILDEVFGQENFVNEIIWSYRSGGASKTASLPKKHDNILFYKKSSNYTITPMMERQYLEKSFMGSAVDEKGRFYVDTILRDVIEGAPNIVVDGEVTAYNTRPVLNLSTERLGYPTQKPEGLLRLLIEIATKEGDLVADFFCGSGTTLAVAEKLNRKWIGTDLGRFAVHTSRKRLIGIQREASKLGQQFRAFEILNLGGYERTHLTGID